jgi:hypothetical protein
MTDDEKKAYLQSIHVGEVDPKQRIKKYLEELSERDEALKTLYRPEKINDCYNFIRDCVKQIGSGNAYCIEDAVVFKMARDYFIDILPKEAAEPPKVKSTKTKAKAEETKPAEPEETEAETPPEENKAAGVDIENSGSSNPRESEKAEETTEAMPKAEQGGLKTDEYGFEVFDGESEQKAEPCGAVETEAETEPEKADNENSGSSNPREAAPKETASEPVHYDENGNGLLFEF